MSKNFIVVAGVGVFVMVIFTGILSYNQAQRKRDREIQYIIAEAKASLEKYERKK